MPALAGSALIARQTSNPFRFGIITSRKTRSGWWCADDVERLVAVARRQQLDAVVLELLERLLDEEPDVLLVVDDEDGRHEPSGAMGRDGTRAMRHGSTSGPGRRIGTITVTTTAAEAPDRRRRRPADALARAAVASPTRSTTPRRCSCR